jgi:hypothetical protein
MIIYDQINQTQKKIDLEFDDKVQRLRNVNIQGFPSRNIDLHLDDRVQRLEHVNV